MTDTFPSNTTLDEAASRMLELAKSTGRPVFGTFNSIPLVALPDDTLRHVVERWEYEERIIGLGRQLDVYRAQQTITVPDGTVRVVVGSQDVEVL